MPRENDLSPRPRPEHEWHLGIRVRNEALRNALNAWIATGDNRRLKRAVVLITAPAFAPPPSPRLRHESDRLLATALRALVVPASPGGPVRDQAAYRETALGRRV